MLEIGKYYGIRTYYLKLEEGYENQLPSGNWICLGIVNEKPENDKLTEFFSNSIKRGISEFKGQGKFGEYLHDFFDDELALYNNELEIMTTGNNKDDLANSFWECYGANSLVDKVNLNELKLICIGFDQNDYSMKLKNILKRFNRKWLPIDEVRTNEEDEFVNLKLTKNESLVLFEFLGRFNDEEREELFEDQSEQRVLWDIECLLEKQLVEPFQNNYTELLQKARDEVRDEIE